MKTIHNKMPDSLKGGDAIEVQISPFGRFRNFRLKEDGKREAFLQECDAEALRQVVANYTDEVLMDYEHDSEDGGSTRAAAWISNLRVDPERGLVGTATFTPAGAAAVAGRELRFLSPCWTVDGNNRPLKLYSVGLTNKPNLPVAPVLNTKPPEATPPEEGKIKDMDTDIAAIAAIAAAVGLTEGATAAEVLSAVTDVVKRLAEAEDKLAQSEAAALEAEAEAAAEKYEVPAANKAAFKKAFVANKDAALGVIGALGISTAQKRVVNTAAARRPAPAAAQVKNRLEEYEAMPEGKAKREFFRNNAVEINKLRNEAKDGE